MRTVGAAALLLCALAAPYPAISHESCGPEKLGVARTVSIDTTGGAHFGSQYQGRRARTLLADGEVVLTFDDGPSRGYTRSILETLAAHCTKATFFMVGRMALSDPQMVKEVAARGHTVGAHTWSHAKLSNLADDKAQTEIELGFSAVQEALGRPISPFFRFPYLRGSSFSIQRLNDRHIAIFSIDIDSRDFETRDAGLLRERVRAGVTARRKGIILFHDIQASTVRALPLILADLKALGFRVVHVTAKAGAKTVPEYDKLAQEELTRRRVTIARSPLAKRAITWPIAGGVPEPKAKTKGAEPPKDAKVTEGAASTSPDATDPAPPAPKTDWTSDLWSQTH
jgi:peptidoglycan/xylan/chitin deacetylase (PgdA/CDA1 family)